MKKKKFSFSVLILIILIVLVGFFAWDIFKYKRAGESPENNKQTSSVPENQEVGECQITDLSNYEIAKVDNTTLELKVDLNGDQKEEVIRIYNQISETGFRNLPIMLKIFSGGQDCQKEEFSYVAENKEEDIKENEVFDFQIFPNFWGDGRKTAMLIGEETAYGSGFSLYMHFFSFKNGEYQKIDGPEFDSLSTYKFRNEESKGKEIIVVQGIWAEGEAHYDYHRYQFEIYTWDGEKYIQKEAGTTKDKYSGDIDEMLKKEPEVLNY